MRIYLKKEKWSPIFSDEFDLESGNIDDELQSIRDNIEDLRSVEGLDDNIILNKYQEYFSFSINGLDDEDDEIFKLMLGTSEWAFKTLHTTLPICDDSIDRLGLYDIVAIVKQSSNIDLDKTYDVVELDKLIRERQIIFLRKSEIDSTDDKDKLRKYLEDEKAFYHLPLWGTLVTYHFDEYLELSTYILSTYSIENLIELIRNLTIEKLAHIRGLCTEKITAHRQAIDDYSAVEEKCKTFELQMLNSKQTDSNKQ